MVGGSVRGQGAIALRSTRIAILLGAVLLLDACSLEGLDRFPFPACNADGHTGCEPLNARDGITDPNACMLWQCDPAGRACVFGARDSDGDTFVAASCGGTDCQDELASAHPGATESCDGTDEDCNGVVDDIDVAHPPAAIDPTVVVTGVSGPSFVELSDAADGFFAVWNASGQTRDALVTQTSAETPSTELLGTTNFDADRDLLEATPASGCADFMLVPLTSDPCATTGTPCSGAQICTPAMLCEYPVTHNVPEHAGECQTHEECSDGIVCNGIEQCAPTSDASLIDGRGCRAGEPDPCAGMGVCSESLRACVDPFVVACDFENMGAAYAGDGEMMTLAVSVQRCPNGRARPGLVRTTDSPPSDIVWGGAHVSTVWDGVDVGTDGCTGASRATGEPHGAQAPSIAVLRRDPTVVRDMTEALAAWIALPAGTPVPGPVEILGLWREQMGVVADTVRFVDGSDDGRPTRLAEPSSSARVGLASYARGADAGYVVAYGRVGGGVSVTTVPHLGAVAPPCSAPIACITPDPGTDTFIGTADDGNPVTTIVTAAPAQQPPRRTPALGTPISTTLDATTTVLGDVTVAAGVPEPTTPPPTTLPIALAWATDADVTIALVRVDPATHVLTDGARLHLPVTGARDVRIVHVEAGISMAGQFAGGTIDASEVGGFVVTWVSNAVGNAGTFAARISDRTHDWIAPGAIWLGAISDEPQAFVDYDDAGENPRVRVAAHQGQGLAVFPNVCGPPQAPPTP